MSLDEAMALQLGGALYFFIFIMFGAFICANLLVAVVTTNLEQCITKYNEEKQQRIQDATRTAYTGLEDGMEDDFPLTPQQPVHVKEVMHDTPMVHRQKLLSFGNLGNLNMSTCEDFCVVLEAIHENLKEYREIRDELDKIVEEVRSIRFNVEQEQEMVLRNIRGADMSDSMVAADVIPGKPMDVVSALATLEKSNLIDTDTPKGGVKTAAMRARRQSQPMVVTEKGHKRKDSLPKGPPDETQETEPKGPASETQEPTPETPTDYEKKRRQSLPEHLSSLLKRRRTNLLKKSSTQSQRRRSSALKEKSRSQRDSLAKKSTDEDAKSP
ncbi:hypothetical protein lerEdw1_009518 [Lerista edwardsae]|nr:hypothetical protein lerEdw1_009518 [Lerista edwardsae]